MAQMDAVISGLERAFVEEQNDVVTLATIIEMYSEELSQSKDQVVFLQKLQELLQENLRLTSELAMLLPNILLIFVTDRNIAEKLVISHVQDCFRELALNGNAKECFLVSCEQISKLAVTGNIQEAIPSAETLYIRFSFLLELLGESLSRIQTQSYSKFLGMLSTSLIGFCQSASTFPDINGLKILEYLYPLFNKHVLPLVDESGTIDDEKELQMKLLRTLLSIMIRMTLKNTCPGFASNYFERKTQDKVQDITGNDILLKYYQLCKKSNVSGSSTFTKLIKETIDIYDNIPINVDTKNESSFEQVLYQASYTYQLKKASEQATLQMDDLGLFILLGISDYFEHYESQDSIASIPDSIYCHLRFCTMAIFSESYSNMCVKDISLYRIWNSLLCTPLNVQIQVIGELPSHILLIFLQLLLLLVAQQKNKAFAQSTLTLFDYVLCLIPQQVACDFIVDTLLTCPYFEAKLHAVSIMKSMLLTDMINTRFKLFHLSKASSKPALPSRVTMVLDDHIMASMHSVTMLVIDTVATEKNNIHLLLSLLNLQVSLSSKWDGALLKTLHTTVEHKLLADATDIPEFGFVKICNDALGKQLN